MKNIKEFNSHLPEGFELVKGKGYFYYLVPNWFQGELNSCMICHFYHATPKFWQAELNEVQETIKRNTRK